MDNSQMRIQLTRGNTALIDLEDGDLAARKWHATSTKRERSAYARTKDKNGRQVLMHRIILERMLGRALVSGEIADHINGDGLDNRRSNLRLADRYTNSQNAKKSKKNTNGYKGTWFSKKKQRWIAHIQAYGILKTIGAFKTQEEAYAAYCKAAKKLHGEFARFE